FAQSYNYVRKKIFIFFFSSRRRHTSWPRDWSSDVCSSDLFLRHSSRGPLVDRPRVLRRVGRLPHEAHDHARRRTHEPATDDPPRHPEAGRLFVPRPEEPQDAARQRGGTRGDVRRPRRPHHPRHPRGLLVHVLEPERGPLPRPPGAERDCRPPDGHRHPDWFHRPYALRVEGESAGGAPAPERRRAARVPPVEPARVWDRAHRLSRNGHIRPPPGFGSHGPVARSVATEAHVRPVRPVPYE